MVDHIMRAVRFYNERYCSFDRREYSPCPNFPSYDECLDPELKGVVRWTPPTLLEPPSSSPSRVRSAVEISPEESKINNYIKKFI